jgi:DNA-3-methyladenine glycosylase I
MTGGVPTIPDVIAPADLGDYLEVMTRAVFQAGVSWAQIARHWTSYREAFFNFDVPRIASFDEGDVERIMLAPGILHSSRKIRATIANAQRLLELEAGHGGFANYIHSFDGYPSLAKDLKRRFAFMGEMNTWYFLFRVGEPVPEFEAWVATIPGDHPRMREMVERAR